MADLIFPTGQNGQSKLINSGDFWPSLDLAEIRNVSGINQSVTDARLEYITINAVLNVNLQLSDFKKTAEFNGYRTLADTATGQINNKAINECHYLYAVCSYVKAKLLEAYSDYDSTNKTAGRSEAKLKQADDYRRDGYIAICNILQQNAVDSELI